MVLTETEMTETGYQFPNASGELEDYGYPIAFFHTFKDGELINQGFIDSINKTGGGTAILFNFLDGAMSKHITFTPAYLDGAVFYDNDAEMNHAYKTLMEK